MISSEQVLRLLKSTESYRVERTVSTGNMDKFCEAICAFANDLHEREYQRLPLAHETVTPTMDSEQLKSGLVTLIFGLRTLTFDPGKLIFEPAKRNHQPEQVISEDLIGLREESFLSWLEQIGVGRREKLLLTCLYENPYIKLGDIAEETQLTVSTTKRLMKSMQQRGFVARKGATKNGYWELVMNTKNENDTICQQ